MKNDLHIRTNFSASANPNASWESVLTKAQEAGLDRISITDFDSCVFHLVRKIVDTKKYFKGEILNGMECDVCENGKTFELLAYNFDPVKTFDWALKVYGTLETRQTKIKDILVALAKEKGFKLDEKMPFNGKTDFGHKYVYENLLKYKSNEKLFKDFNINNLSDFYRLSTTTKNFPLYVNMNKIWPSVKKVVNFIHSVGGIVVLAHPFKHRNKIDIDTLLNYVLKFDLDGVEVYHPTHTEKEIKQLLNFCLNHHLVVTGGSNFNGTENNNTMGIQNIDKAEKYILK